MAMESEPRHAAAASPVLRRIDLRRRAPEAYRALAGVERALASGPLEPALRELVKVRASQLNGCAYCLGTHLPAARRLGLTDDKLDVLDGWRDAEVFDRRERAALAIAERLTLNDDPAATDAAIAAARAEFDEDAVAALVFNVAIMNAWNRLHGPAHTPPPPSHAAVPDRTRGSE